MNVALSIVVNAVVAPKFGGVDGRNEGDFEQMLEGARRVPNQPIVGMNQIKWPFFEQKFTTVFPQALVHVDHPVKKVVAGCNANPVDIHTIDDFVPGCLTKLYGYQMNFVSSLRQFGVQLCYMPSNPTHNSGWKFPSQHQNLHGQLSRLLIDLNFTQPSLLLCSGGIAILLPYRIPAPIATVDLAGITPENHTVRREALL